MSETARISRLTEPGSPVVSPVPNATEQPESGGVNWTTRKSSPRTMSASSLQPRLA